MVFAAERGKQVVRQLVGEKLTRIYGATVADSLVAQLRAINIRHSAVAGSSVSVELSGTTYVFDQIVRNVAGGMSGLVTQYNSDGEKVADYDIRNIASPDENRVDFSVSPSTPEGSWTEDGVLVGIQDNPGTAMALVSVDGGDSRLSLVDFSGLAASASSAAADSADSLVTVTPFQDSHSTQGGVAVDPVTCLVTICVGAVVIIGVIIACWLAAWAGWFSCL
jgi:hypothetical protein